MRDARDQTNGTEGFVVFPFGTEYHMTREITFAYKSRALGKQKGVKLNSLCGVYVGSASCEGGDYANERPVMRLYLEPPQGFVLCRSCERMSIKKRGWARLFSHLFQNRRGLRAALNAYGRCS
jgi:hypothetical protein